MAKCGVAVIRITGPKSSEAVTKIAGLKLPLQPRYASLRRLKDPESKEMLDKGLVIWFPGPRSFTGEDSCEFQIHGGTAIISAVLSALSKLEGFRPAEPGEFTKRAFHAGKLDLTEVEGLADLIHAETEAQRKQALLQSEGILSKLYNTWRETLIRVVAHVEAYIDFSEDENIRRECHGSSGDSRQRLDEEYRGQRPAAIVTPIAGTTRDVVELNINIGGYPMVLADTAGLRGGVSDAVESEGIARAHKYAHSADLIILVLDATKYIAWTNQVQPSEFTEFVKNSVTDLNLDYISPKAYTLNSSMNIENNCESAKKCLIIVNKSDLVQETMYLKNISQQYSNVVPLSCKTEDGFPALLTHLEEHLAQLCGNPSRENPCLTQARHRHHLTDCLSSLESYFKHSQTDGDIVLAAHQLRKALRHLGKITGHVNTEQILDVIFKEFCIGK
ncbi:unnamed protein product [Timema podura]|uniref:tRNA modification GTPase GTPBP3, mitochondrial n=1 Tax=Timema podura TaxID=61482 RepID=A0ABN7NW81_TIMPD|nr:unnamed protein product [Timema podura]